MGKNQRSFLLSEKPIIIQKDQSDNESDAIDIDQCDNESKSEQEVNNIELFSSTEDEDLHSVDPSKKRARVIISDF
ncbi:hypothetical protein TNIN_69541 [Trichonephila inaurata madagascariensis]|uniref:Uncharacterized protein n=1 Tax=Trichonephila inaurata madagascariensis TaxID=2747483 RepID=A0A8X7BUA3_9ARAC|nr:hypothetical protein TNIN_69541 [Trichonephila inaurata madagascariensis]